MENTQKYFETIKEIDECKKIFENQLENKLNLVKVQSPIFVKGTSGLQDQLTGVEKAICFEKGSEKFEIVHSLAKWKRMALGKYEIPMHHGLYTDMKAIRKDEIVDNLHSLYVEQWDWEEVIDKQDRNIDFLKNTVNNIYDAIKETAKNMKEKYTYLSLDLPEKIFFITSQELENIYPDKTPSEREQLIGKEKKAVFIIGIGDKLKSGIVHDKRSPDYDDWGLNGDLLVYDDVINKTIELSSMGIRVDENSLKDQLEKANCLDRINFPYHQEILHKELPYTIGGGIGQSRVLMLMLNKKHIAEVQASAWESKTELELKNMNIL